MDIIIAYVPVIHRGYLSYFASTGASIIYALQADDLPGHPQLKREVRALTFGEVSKALAALGYDVRPYADLYEGGGVPAGTRVFMPEDDITKDLIIDAEVVLGSWFLRWDWSKSTAQAFVQPEADRIIRQSDASHAQASERMNQLLKAARQSSDWWRQVAAMAIARDGRTIVAYNKHYPNERAPYVDGDPRDSFNPGEFIEISSAMHAEQAVIAEAARRGISLEEAELYVTTFPCNLCAPWIPTAGFKSVYFTGGYSNLNGQRTLREHGVELIYVEV